MGRQGAGGLRRRGREGEQVATRRGLAGRGGRGWGREGRVHGKSCFRVRLRPRRTPFLGELSCGSPAHPRVTRTRAPDSLSINPRRT